MDDFPKLDGTAFGSFHALVTAFRAELADPPELPIVKKWDPRAVGAPERHALNGWRTGMPHTLVEQLLQGQNKAFVLVEMHLDIPFGVLNYNGMNEEKEQVWLFGYRWLQAFEELMVSAYSQRMRVDDVDQEPFLVAMRAACSWRVSSRPTFDQLCALFDGARAAASAAASASAAAAPPAEETGTTPSPSDLPVASAPESVAPPAAPLPVAAATSAPQAAKSRRLVLSGSILPVGRNKTRKSQRT